MTIGIYKITNNINGKIYIGQSINIERRIKDHFNLNKKKKQLLKSSIISYGKENFSWEILEECNKDNLNEREIYYIKQLNSLHSSGNGYNLTEGGDQNIIFDQTLKDIISKRTMEGMQNDLVREKISSGIREKWKNEEYRNKLSGNKKKEYMNASSVREKISNSLKDYYNHNESKNKGKTASRETKQKISNARKKYFENEEALEKNRNQVKQNYINDPTLKEKISKSLKETNNKPEQVEKRLQKRIEHYKQYNITKEQLKDAIIKCNEFKDLKIVFNVTSKVIHNLCKLYFKCTSYKKLILLFGEK